MDYATKLVYQSNYWYNDGLKKANIRDLSGAIVSLRRSLQYNRSNIAARNLLGLVYYGRGDVAEALVEWILSKNFQSHDNIANYYIQKTRENTAELETINQAVKKYNQALSYAKQNGEDLAIIQLKKSGGRPSFVCEGIPAAGAFVPAYRAVLQGKAGDPRGSQAGQDGRHHAALYA